MLDYDDTPCMMCGSQEHDASESERRRDGSGNEWWVFWVYCRKCDCWTEHAPADMPEYL